MQERSSPSIFLNIVPPTFKGFSCKTTPVTTQQPLKEPSRCLFQPFTNRHHTRPSTKFGLTRSSEPAHHPRPDPPHRHAATAGTKLQAPPGPGSPRQGRAGADPAEPRDPPAAAAARGAGRAAAPPTSPTRRRW